MPEQSEIEKDIKHVMGVAYRLGEARTGVQAALERIAAAAREAEELRGQRCTHGWRGKPPERAPVIADKCPACGGQLFIGNGGWITCASVPGGGSKGCPSPGTFRYVEFLRQALRDADAAELNGKWIFPFYRADGSFERLPVADWIARRKQAAVEMETLRQERDTALAEAAELTIQRDRETTARRDAVVRAAQAESRERRQAAWPERA